MNTVIENEGKGTFWCQGFCLHEILIGSQSNKINGTLLTKEKKESSMLE